MAGRFLGVDSGERRVGLALSDRTRTFARPLKVLERGPRLLAELAEVIREEEVERVVLGLPRNMDGSLGPKAREALSLRETLERELGLPVDTWDERLTTVEALRILRQGGASRRKVKESTDKLAAQILLQSYLDAHAREGEPP